MTFAELHLTSRVCCSSVTVTAVTAGLHCDRYPSFREITHGKLIRAHPLYFNRALSTDTTFHVIIRTTGYFTQAIPGQSTSRALGGDWLLTRSCFRMVRSHHLVRMLGKYRVGNFGLVRVDGLNFLPCIKRLLTAMI